MSSIAEIAHRMELSCPFLNPNLRIMRGCEKECGTCVFVKLCLHDVKVAREIIAADTRARVFGSHDSVLGTLRLYREAASAFVHEWFIQYAAINKNPIMNILFGRVVHADELCGKAGE